MVPKTCHKGIKHRPLTMYPSIACSPELFLDASLSNAVLNGAPDSTPSSKPVIVLFSECSIFVLSKTLEVSILHRGQPTILKF